MLGDNLACPPCNVGPRSTPNYDALAAAAVHHLPPARRCSPASGTTASSSTSARSSTSATSGSSRSIHLIPSAAGTSVDPLKTLNIHTIAIKVPISHADAGTAPCRATRSSPGPCSASGAARAGARCRCATRTGSVEGERPVGAGLAPRQPALQRGHRPGRGQGPLERGRPDRRQRLREVREPARAREAPAGPLPRRVPEPRGVHQGPGGPPRDPAHGHPERRRPRVPELHRAEAGGHAAAERRDPADHLEPERPRPGRRRRRRLPERAARVRRRRLDRAEGDRGRDDSARRPELHAGRRGRRGLVVPHAGSRPLPVERSPTSARPTTDTTRHRRDPEPRTTPRTPGPST